MQFQVRVLVAVEEGDFQHRGLGGVGKQVAAGARHARGVHNVAEQAVDDVGLLQLVRGVGVVLRIVDAAGRAAQANGHQQHSGAQVEVVVTRHVLLRCHRHAIQIQGGHGDGCAGGDVAVVGVEQCLAVAHGGACAAVEGQQGVHIGFHGAGSCAAQHVGQAHERTQVIVDDGRAAQVDDVAFGACRDAGLFAVRDGLVHELAQLVDGIEATEAAGAVAVVSAEVAHTAGCAKAVPGQGGGGVGGLQRLVHGVFEEHREVAGALGEGGGHHFHGGHAGHADPSALQRCAGGIEQAVATVRVGRQRGAGSGVLRHASTGQDGGHHGVFALVAFVRNRLDLREGVLRVGRLGTLAHLGQQAGLNGFDGQARVCQHFGLQRGDFGARGEGLEHGDHLGVVVLGARECNGCSGLSRRLLFFGHGMLLWFCSGCCGL